MSNNRSEKFVVVKVLTGPLVAVILIFSLWLIRSGIACVQTADFYVRSKVSMGSAEPQSARDSFLQAFGAGAPKEDVEARLKRVTEILDERFGKDFAELDKCKREEATNKVSSPESLTKMEALEKDALNKRSEISGGILRSLLGWIVPEMLLALALILVFPALHIANISVLKRERSTGSPSGVGAEDECVSNPIHIFFFRRFALSALIAAGWLYVLSPVGIGTSAVEKYVRWSGSLGISDFPPWMTDLSKAPILCYGFLGFYLYALTLWLGRFYLHDLTDGIYISLIRRAFAVLILSLVLAQAPTIGNPTAAVSSFAVFLIGLFPQTGISFIKMKVAEYSKSSEDNVTIPLSKLRGLSMWQQARLEEEGITSVEDLANYDVGKLTKKVAYDPLTLYKLCDQATLISRVGADKYEKFVESSISSADELLEFINKQPADVKDLENRVGLFNLNFLAERIRTEQNTRSPGACVPGLANGKQGPRSEMM